MHDGVNGGGYIGRRGDKSGDNATEIMSNIIECSRKSIIEMCQIVADSQYFLYFCFFLLSFLCTHQSRVVQKIQNLSHSLYVL